jgi:hypothetical protein
LGISGNTTSIWSQNCSGRNPKGETDFNEADRRLEDNGMKSYFFILEQRVSMNLRHSPNHSLEWMGALRSRGKLHSIDQPATGLSPSDERPRFE